MHSKSMLGVVSYLVCATALWHAPAADAAETAEVAGISLERLERLDALLEREIAAGRLSGMVVAVARHGQAIQRNYGYMDLESREPMRADAMFRLYSMTKPIASVALLTLYEQGLFQLTDPLDRYIPQFANLKVYAGKDANGRPILEAPKRKPTVQDAFRHTLGLSGGLGNTDVDALYREAGLGMFELDSLRQEIDRLATVPLRYSPGDQWVYGLGHDVQAYLVEHFSGSLRALHGARFRHAEPVRVGAGLLALRADAAERWRARRRTHSRPQDGGAHGSEPPAAEYSVDRS
jgi:CubicO group peptidase (beta-lactamase class C family)